MEERGKSLGRWMRTTVMSKQIPQRYTPVFHELVQIFLHVLKYEVQVVIFSNDLLEFDDIGMIELLQGLKE